MMKRVRREIKNEKKKKIIVKDNVHIWRLRNRNLQKNMFGIKTYTAVHNANEWY